MPFGPKAIILLTFEYTNRVEGGRPDRGPTIWVGIQKFSSAFLEQMSYFYLCVPVRGAGRATSSS